MAEQKYYVLRTHSLLKKDATLQFEYRYEVQELMKVIDKYVKQNPAEKENLTADVEATESDIKALKQEKADAENARDQVRENKEQVEKELKHMEKQRNQLQPIINSIDKELKNSGQIKLVLPEAGALELASTYRNKKIKPLFAKMKNYMVGLTAKVIELSREAEEWRNKYQQ